MDDLIDVGRHLTVIDGLLADSAATAFESVEHGFGRDASWDEVLKRRLCLLLGRANTGKTSELKLLKKRQELAGRTAFLLPLRVFNERHIESLESIFDRNDADLFSEWTETDREALFLLDSIDEAELFHEGAFMQCLRVLRVLLGDDLLRRAHWVVSSRPGAWSSRDVANAIRSELCPAMVTSRVESNGEDFADQETHDEPPVTDIVVVALKPLTATQSQTLLRDAFKCANAAEAPSLAQNLGLSFVLRSPGDLKWFSRLTEATPRPQSRLEAFEIASRSLATARTNEMTAPLNEVMAELEELCAASLLCENWLFALRESEDSTGSLRLAELLGHRDLSFEKLIRALPIFGEADFHRIKVIPEQLAHFLAAKWFSRRMRTPAEQRALVDRFRRESVDGPLIPWHLMVCAGWLSVMSPGFRERIQSFAPHVTLFLGDMSGLTPDEGATVLHRTFDLMTQGHALIPNSLMLSSDDYWHIARPELIDALIECLQRYADHPGCVIHILKILGSRRNPQAVPALRNYLANSPCAGWSAALCIDGIEECGTSDDVEWAARRVLESGSMDQEVARNTACSVIRLNGEPELVVSLCERLTTDEVGVKYAFSSAIEAVDDARALRYAKVLLARNESKHSVKSVPEESTQDHHDESQVPVYPLQTVALALLQAHLSKQVVLPDTFDETIELLETVRKYPLRHDGYEQFEDFPEITVHIPTFRRRALLFLANKLPTQSVYKLRHGSYLYVQYDHDDHDLIREVQCEVHSDQGRKFLDDLIQITPRPMPRPVSTRQQAAADKRVEAHRKRAETDRVVLEADAPEIRACTSLLKVGRAAALVARTSNNSSRYSYADWPKILKLYGEDTTEAVKEGFRRLWRQETPTFDPMKTNSTSYQTVAGLLGLHLELVVESRIQSVSRDEAIKAFEYSKFEINQFPDWVLPLAQRFPAEFDAFIVETLQHWDSSPVAAEHARAVLGRVSDKPELTRSEAFVSALFKGLVSGAWSEPFILSRAFDVLTEHAAKVEPEFAKIVAERSASTYIEADSYTFNLWFSAWIRLDPDSAITWLENRSTAADGESWKLKAASLASYWHSDQKDMLSFVLEDSALRCRFLCRLYRVFIAEFSRDKQPVRLGVHTPTQEDDAHRFRDSLLSQIAKVGGYPAVHTLRRLRERRGADAWEKRGIDRLILGAVENAAKAPAWSVTQFLVYARQAVSPLLDPQTLWQVVRQDVDEIIRNLQEGEFAPRGMLLRSKEKDMQLWLSREMQLMARDGYRVIRERELANGTTPDVTVLSRQGDLVTLELKLGDARNSAKLMADLRRQLHDDYMQHENWNFGIFVVMWRDDPNPTQRVRKRARVTQIAARLQGEAIRLCSASRGRKYLEVRCFFCPIEKTRRNEEKATRARKGKKMQAVRRANR